MEFVPFYKNSGQEQRHQHNGGDYRTGVRLEEIGTHSGDIANVVAYGVGDGSWIAGIIFGNASLDFSDQVAANVGRFGVDATANTCEQCNGTRAKSERGYNLKRAVNTEPGDPQQIVEGDAK